MTDVKVLKERFRQSGYGLSVELGDYGVGIKVTVWNDYGGGQSIVQYDKDIEPAAMALYEKLEAYYQISLISPTGNKKIFSSIAGGEIDVATGKLSSDDGKALDSNGWAKTSAQKLEERPVLDENGWPKGH